MRRFFAFVPETLEKSNKKNSRIEFGINPGKNLPLYFRFFFNLFSCGFLVCFHVMNSFHVEFSVRGDF